MGVSLDYGNPMSMLIEETIDGEPCPLASLSLAPPLSTTFLGHVFLPLTPVSLSPVALLPPPFRNTKQTMITSYIRSISRDRDMATVAACPCRWACTCAAAGVPQPRGIRGPGAAVFRYGSDQCSPCKRMDRGLALKGPDQRASGDYPEWQSIHCLQGCVLQASAFC